MANKNEPLPFRLADAALKAARDWALQGIKHHIITKGSSDLDRLAGRMRITTPEVKMLWKQPKDPTLPQRWLQFPDPYDLPTLLVHACAPVRTMTLSPYYAILDTSGCVGLIVSHRTQDGMGNPHPVRDLSEVPIETLLVLGRSLAV